MTRKDELYNAFRKYLQDNGVGFPADLATSLGDEFLKHITNEILPLSMSVWVQINDKHNRGGAVPDPCFKIFFGKKKLGHKADKPCLMTTAQHRQELWFGMGKVLTEENWPVVAVKIKHLSLLIQNYARRISSQVVRQARLFNTEQSARSVENAANVAVIPSLLLRLTLPDELFQLNMKLMHLDGYMRLEVNTFMEGLVAWQR
jgi:hypothetical protein